jgi:hypothetical protein
LVFVLVFVWAVSRFWHPYYGFTLLLQNDTASAQQVVPALRDAPVFVHPGPGSYDGFFYAQIATDPSLRTPELREVVDDLGYRARRILLSAVAWAAAGGDPVGAVRVYAWINILVWLALAAVLWRILPAVGWREHVAWVGILAGAGALLSVRLALTDLPALLLLTAGCALAESGRIRGAGASIGLAALCRETSLLGAVALLPRRRPLADGRTVTALCLAAGPLVLWLAFLLWRLGASGAGQGNFGAPLVGWWGKLLSLGAAQVDPHYRALAVTALLGHLALALQAGYLLWRRDWSCPWWRLGAAYVGLMLLLGPAVWGEDLPGAAVRVLLPVTLSFNVIAARRRAGWPWLIGGNLAVLGGVVALWLVQTDPRELTAGRAAGTGYVVAVDQRWYAPERGRNRTWAWCSTRGGMEIRTWPPAAHDVQVRLALRAHAPGTIEIRDERRCLWRGPVGPEWRWITLPPVPAGSGRLRLELASEVPPQLESAAPGARALGFAVYGVEIE